MMTVVAFQKATGVEIGTLADRVRAAHPQVRAWPVRAAAPHVRSTRWR
jgi:hypothetical protein